MKKRGHYCKICGEYKSNEKFSGKGHAAHICKACAFLPPEKKSEMAAMNRLLNLPWRLSKEQISWLKKKMHDKRPDIRALAKEQYGRYPDESDLLFLKTDDGTLYSAKVCFISDIKEL